MRPPLVAAALRASGRAASGSIAPRVERGASARFADEAPVTWGPASGHRSVPPGYDKTPLGEQQHMVRPLGSQSGDRETGSDVTKSSPSASDVGLWSAAASELPLISPKRMAMHHLSLSVSPSLSLCVCVSVCVVFGFELGGASNWTTRRRPL